MESAQRPSGKLLAREIEIRRDYVAPDFSLRAGFDRASLVRTWCLFKTRRIAVVNLKAEPGEAPFRQVV